ncbi:hypothetical protein BBP40_002779 [Aspergillus hancockii]|nr:hypothetical protein BBP40_002779 [Aspergillus hancockii]
MSQKLQDQAEQAARFAGFWARHFNELAPPLPTSINLSGKTAIVTGSNVGLGLESARHLLSLQLSHLILAVRSQSKGDAAASELQREHPNANVEVWLLDMESYKSILDFVQRCKNLPRIHIAILNAGLAVGQFRRVSETQHETTLQVNYLSTAFLALHLLPCLKPRGENSEPGRLTLVGSDTSYHAPGELPNLHSSPLIESIDTPETWAGGFDQYKFTKLFQVIFVAKLADQISAEDVVVNIAMPGLCKRTAFVRKPDGKWYMRLLLSLFGKEPERGANVIVDATVVQGIESHGSLLSEGVIEP